jgi:hypothetical protein
MKDHFCVGVACPCQSGLAPIHGSYRDQKRPPLSNRP